MNGKGHAQVSDAHLPCSYDVVTAGTSLMPGESSRMLGKATDALLELAKMPAAKADDKDRGGDRAGRSFAQQAARHSASSSCEHSMCDTI